MGFLAGIGPSERETGEARVSTSLSARQALLAALLLTAFLSIPAYALITYGFMWLAIQLKTTQTLAYIIGPLQLLVYDFLILCALFTVATMIGRVYAKGKE